MQSPPLTVVPVNRRVKVPDVARLALKDLYEQAARTQGAVGLYLSGLSAGLGIDPSKVVQFDDSAGELVLEEADPARVEALKNGDQPLSEVPTV
jgi:hypothetical protein